MPLNETAIRQWADSHECRSNLPVLIRRLIRETTSALTSLRFPGNEAVDLTGLDGRAEVDQATIWVPQGHSIWEMGCNQDPRAKANEDFLKRTDETPKEEQENSSFVFITPRRWQAKEAWLKERRQEGSWADVFAYDAIDLETWLEEAPVTSRWLGERLGLADPVLLTPDEWWKMWSSASTPPISPSLVATRRHNEAETLLQKLRDGDQVVPVMGDDRGEAVAFVIAALGVAGAHDFLDRTLVVTSEKVVIPRNGNSRLIVIADIPEGNEPNFGDRHGLTIVRPYPKGRLDVNEALQLSHVPSEVFRTELEAMGISRDKADSLSLEAGHSISVLRRRLSKDPEIRRPVWARDRETAKRLLPFALAGSWIERENLDDVTILQLIGELEDGEAESIRDDLLALDDAPLAKYGNVNIIVSQLDALFTVGPYTNQNDLDRFFQIVPELLGDRDPALDLPQDQWHMANVLGKARSTSGALLSGLSDALCILAVHGAEICGTRLDIDLSYRAGQVVRALMANANAERWLTIRGHLRALAEAAPITFLDCLEEELRKPDPAIQAIMGVAGGLVGGECLRTELLWALEALAWHPAHFSRVADIVFDLQRFEIDDNWTNSPASTAKSLFLVWLPATSLGLNDRIHVLRKLSTNYRMPTIEVCISLLPDAGPSFTTRNALPRWRVLEEVLPDVTDQDVRHAAIEASRLLLDLAPFDKSELEKLLEVTTRLHPLDLDRLVNEVERWSLNAADEEKAELRHNLRNRNVMRAYQENADSEELIAALQRMEDALEPDTAAARHRWLFQDTHIEWRALVEDEGNGWLSWQEREVLVQERRAEAMAEIEAELGEDAIVPFALNVKHPEAVAQVLVPFEAPPETVAKWVGRVLPIAPTEATKTFLRHVLWTAGRTDLSAAISLLKDQGILARPELRQRIAEFLPSQATGWDVAASLGEEAEKTYWHSAYVIIRDEMPNKDVGYAINKLISAKRPRSALAAARLQPERIEPQKWVYILEAIAKGEEPEGPFPGSYELDRVLERLDKSPDISDEQIAGLELPFVQLLCGYGHRSDKRTLALHRELARKPELFIQLLCWEYKRRDGSVEPQNTSQEHQEFLANLAYHTFEGWNTIPGLDENGEIDANAFRSWSTEALKLASGADRLEVAETHLAALLARFARHRAWDNWLPDVILEFINNPTNGGLRKKFRMGVHNARGVTSRGPYDGGAQERRLAENYRKLAVRYRNSYPRTSSLLISIAESFERDANQHDERAAVGERWHP